MPGSLLFYTGVATISDRDDRSRWGEDGGLREISSEQAKAVGWGLKCEEKSVPLPPLKSTGCSTVGSAPRSGRGGRKFESSQAHHNHLLIDCDY